MTSDTVATLNQSHTVITTPIAFWGYETNAFFTVYVWFAEIKAILTNTFDCAVHESSWVRCVSNLFPSKHLFWFCCFTSLKVHLFPEKGIWAIILQFYSLATATEYLPSGEVVSASQFKRRRLVCRQCSVYRNVPALCKRSGEYCMSRLQSHTICTCMHACIHTGRV